MGMTLPDEARTLPKRTPQKRVFVSSRCPHASTSHSQSAFDCPMTVFGFTALSVDTRTKRLASNSTATSATVRVTSELLRTASSGFASISGTCLYAAAWKTTAGRYLSKTCLIFRLFPASASTAAVAWNPRSSTSSRSISNSPGSPLSTSTSLARCRGNRDQELVRATIVKQVLELRRRAQDADAVQPQVLLPRVVVDEPDGRVPERRGAQHLAQDLLGRVSGSHDDDLFAPGDDRPGGRALDQRAREEPAARHEGEQQQEIDDPDPPRNPSRMKGREREDEEHDDDGDADSSEGAPHVPRRDVPPPPVVEPECDEDRNRDGDDEEDDVPVEVPPVVDRRLRVEAHVPGEHPGRSDEGHVDDQLPETVAIDGASHARTPSVACTVSTTRSCCSSVIPAQSGTEKFSRAARSVSGRSPSL